LLQLLFPIDVFRQIVSQSGGDGFPWGSIDIG
jgi:hypothetical protein